MGLDGKSEENIQRTQFCPEQYNLPALSQGAPRAIPPTLRALSGGPGTAEGMLPGFSQAYTTGLGCVHPDCLPPAHPSPRQACLELNTSRESEKQRSRCRTQVCQLITPPAPPPTHSVEPTEGALVPGRTQAPKSDLAAHTRCESPCLGFFSCKQGRGCMILEPVEVLHEQQPD